MKTQFHNIAQILGLVMMFNFPLNAKAVESKGNFIKDPKSGCIVWFKHYFSEDSVSWSGTCKDGYAEGNGVAEGFTNGRKTYTYTGEMKEGKPHGAGKMQFGNQKLEGNFSEGEILNLKLECLDRLNKHIVYSTDSANDYVSDNGKRNIYYQILIPTGPIKACIVLMPGTWETTEHMLSSNKVLAELAFDKGIAVMALSINQRLTLNTRILGHMNSMFSDAVKRYSIPKNKFVIGGFSMGGLFSLRYTEFAYRDSALCSIKPAAVFSCDGPCDLEHLYENFKNKLAKFPNNGESAYGIEEMEYNCGGTPKQIPLNYLFYSCYTRSDKYGGNAVFLRNVPVRIYGDVDPLWWMQNRHVDMYDMNSLDQTAMILLLNEMGNKRAEFINAYQKGYRLEGYRHPHSWSIVEPFDCIKWINEVLGLE